MACPVCKHIVARSSDRCMNCGNTEFLVETGEVESGWLECGACRGTGKYIRTEYRAGFWGRKSYEKEETCSTCDGRKEVYYTYAVRRDSRS
jgi:hypothetical protein